MLKMCDRPKCDLIVRHCHCLAFETGANIQNIKSVRCNCKRAHNEMNGRRPDLIEKVIYVLCITYVHFLLQTKLQMYKCVTPAYLAAHNFRFDLLLALCETAIRLGFNK